MAEPQSIFEAFHGISIAGNLAVIVLILKEYKVQTRVKERVNQMWRVFCKEHELVYTSVQKNGE